MVKGKKKKQKLLLIDGNALIHRGFHAMPHLSTKKGEPTNGVYGFASLFLSALNSLKPDYVVATFDLPAPTFRDELYKEYKAKRVAAPDELYVQIPRVKELVQAFNVPIYEKEGYEADDLIGTISHQASEKDLETVILTGDFDALQLVNDQVKVYAPKKGLSQAELFGNDEVYKKYNLKSHQLIDYKALRGDPSDNIPGVRGVGDKTATLLLREFGNLKEIYDFVHEHPDGKDKMTPRIAKLLLEDEEQAFLSRQLAQIVCDVPLKFDLEKAKTTDFDESKVVNIFQELEFQSLLDRLPKTDNTKSLAENISNYGKEYILLNSTQAIKEFVEELKKQKRIAVDTETTSQKPVEAQLIGIGFSWQKDKAYYLPIDNQEIHPEIIRVLKDKKIDKIGHNLKYDYLVLKRSGIEMSGMVFDTMVAAYLLDPGARSYKLDNLAFTEFGYRMTPIEDLIGKGKNQITLDQVEIEKVSDYCCEDVDMTWQLWTVLEKELKNKKLEKVFDDIEIPLIKALSDMEENGVIVNDGVLKNLTIKAEKYLQSTEKKIYSKAGTEFNIGSPQQLAEVLYDKMGLPTENIKKGKTGYSTASSELGKLEGLDPIIEMISEWREVSKLLNTYLKALPKLINKQTKRIHTSFNQTVTATGRLSSTDPNLQNIPIRTEMGREIREAFQSEKGYSFLSADYSQIELRIGAHLSDDKKMIKIFQSEGDIHTATAREMFGLKSDKEVSSNQRRYAKVINFGILYGLSAYGLTERIPEVSRVEAKEFIDKYKEVYSGLNDYLKNVIKQTKEAGFVVNELGRRRNLPEINSSQWQIRAAAERAAINMPLQSLAADIIKLAMNEFERQGLTDKQDCRLLLQVHDELVFEIKDEEVESYAKKAKQIMENIYKLKVPIVVHMKTGKNWKDMKALKA